MEKGKIFYKVRLIKEFKYPKSMLEKGYEQEDARNKAHNDIFKTINEITNNKFEDIQVNTFFETEVKEDKGWKLRGSEEKSTKVNLDDIINTFAQTDFEKKFGILNIEENPDLFEFEEGNWFLKVDMEKEFAKFKAQYRMKLSKFRVESAEIPRRNTRRFGEAVVRDVRRRPVTIPATTDTVSYSNVDTLRSIVDNFIWEPSRPLVTGTTGGFDIVANPNTILDSIDQVELEREASEREILSRDIDVSAEQAQDFAF